MEKVRNRKIMEMIGKAGSEKYETSWDDEGKFSSKKKSEIKKGKLSRGQGGRFELKVRGELESREWFLDKWNNNVEFEKDSEDKIISSTGKLVKAKRKYNPFKKMLVVGTGFPDFVAFKKAGEESYDVIGVEVKMNGTLSKIEKEKCAWYLQKEIFNRILIAKKGEKRGEIKYDNFLEKYGKKYNKT
jgi:hypothetical protein